MFGINLRVPVSLDDFVSAGGRILGTLGKSVKSHVLFPRFVG
jgi:hypothetical protein